MLHTGSCKQWLSAVRKAIRTVFPPRAQDSTYLHCNDGEGTAEHVLLHCPALQYTGTHTAYTHCNLAHTHIRQE